MAGADYTIVTPNTDGLGGFSLYEAAADGYSAGARSQPTLRRVSLSAAPRRRRPSWARTSCCCRVARWEK